MLNSGIFDKKLKVGQETSEAYNEFSNNFPYLQQLSTANLNGSLWKRTFEKIVWKSAYKRKLYINILSYSYIIIFFIEFYISLYNTM